MKTLNFKSLFMVLGILIFSYSISNGQIHESFAFPADDMTLTTDTIDGIVYCNVSYYDSYCNGETGHPSLPVKYYTFSVPYNATNISVSTDVLDTNIILAPAKVFPMQEPQPADGSATIDFTLPNNEIYNTNAFYPSQLAKIVDDGYFKGDNHVVTIAVYPIQYNPISNNLKVNNEIVLNISYSLVNESNLPLSVLSRNIETLREEGINNTKSFVYNPASVSGFAAPFTPPITPLTTECLPMYQYCIITSRELAPAFERLVAFKKNKGYDAGIVCMEDIIACENYADGDIISGINDEAGKLRAFLSDAFKNGTEFVLLGGKEPHVPIRYGHDGIGSSFNSAYQFIPTDLYFADLNGNWNVDNDIFYGETKQDSIDYNYELIVGRLLCKNLEEVNNYIDKLLTYELNPGNGNYDYLEHCLYTFSNSMIGSNNTYYCPVDNNKHNAVDYIRHMSMPIFENQTIITQNGNYPSGTEVISLLNSSPQGFISFHGHGIPNNVCLTDKGSQCDTNHAICALDDECYYVFETAGDGLDNMTNRYYPNISYSMSCTLMPYDIYSNYNVSYNFGESFTLGKNYGGVAFLGNTRMGWIPPSIDLEGIFLNQILNGKYCIGLAEAESKKIYKAYNYVRLSHNLLGDPEFEIWTGIPVKYTDADIEISRNNQGISVSGSCLEGAKIVVLNTNGDILNGVGKAVGSTTFSASPNSHVVIYRHNMIPYLAPIVIQNETINNPWHYFASSVNIGSNADPNRESGNVIFDYNSNCIIDASEDVILGPGLTLNSGAKLTIRSKGKITINRCTIKTGATLNLEGQSIEIKNNINCETNSNFNFNLIEN